MVTRGGVCVSGPLASDALERRLAGRRGSYFRGQSSRLWPIAPTARSTYVRADPLPIARLLTAIYAVEAVTFALLALLTHHFSRWNPDSGL
jgi:hypothetical protein